MRTHEPPHMMRARTALGYLLVTIITGALLRAEDIALAAEARAFSPESTRAWPIKLLDKWVIAAALVGLVLLVLV